MHHTVLLFTGHLLDSIDRISARFPYRLISEVRRLIAREVKNFTDEDVSQIAISSLAAGSDILFAEEVLQAGCALNVFLPYTPQEFVQRSVRYTKNHPDEGPDEWIERFSSCIERATSLNVVAATDGIDPYAACNRDMLQYALAFAGQHRNRIRALAMMESGSEIKQGGTAAFADEIELAGIQVKRLWPHRPHRLYR
jgi:hypothetical protein